MYCSLAEVKLAIKQGTSETQYDELLSELIVDVGDRINSMLPHIDLRQNTYTEYHRGGSASIVLVCRPLISVTSVHDDTSHEFGSDVLVASADYFTDRDAVATIQKKSGTFQIGSRNLKVIYDAGYESTPPFVRRLAVELVVAAHQRRANPNVKSSGIREGTWTRFDLDGEEQRMKRILAPLL